ncbi:phytoene desaturase family protein [Candidatus Omnitrophota bacterium]
MRSKYDIVVIGAGIGGLVSAAILAESGKKVLVIEKEPKPGGYLTEFRNEHFVFDVSLHLLNACSEGHFAYNILKECGITDEIKFLKPRFLYRSIFPDHDLKIPQSDLEGYKRLLIEHFPQEKRGINSFVNETSQIFEQINTHRSFTSIMPAILPYLKNNCETAVSKYITDEKLKAIICQLWIYFGLPPSVLRAIDFCYPWIDYLKNGGYYVEKGSYAIVKALVKQIKKRGGDFLFNKSVDRVIVKDGLCCKVGFGKDDISCNAVISNADLTKTVFGLVGSDAFRPENIKKLKAIEPSISAFEIFLGLDTDLKEKYRDDYEIFVNSDYDIEGQYQACLENKAKKAPFVITINSNVNRFSAPEGKSVITIIMLAGYKYWVSKSRNEYQDKKQQIANILIDRAVKVIPEMSGNIHTKVISTPITFKRYTYNSGGAIYGYAKTNHGRTIETRPNELGDVKNLYFASAWAKQGSGVTKVLRSADHVSKKILNNKPVKVRV